MFRPVGVRTLVAALALLVAAQAVPAAPAPEEKTPLERVPAAAPLVLHLNGLERTKNRIITLVQKALPDYGDLVATALNDAFKDGVSGRKLQGVPKDGHIFLVFTEMPVGGAVVPKAALIVSVDDYAKFRDGLLTPEEAKELKMDKEAGYESVTVEGETLYFINKKSYAVLAVNKEVASTFTKPFKSLEGKISKAQSSKLLDHDLGIYLSMDVFNKDYAEQIKAAKEAMNTQAIQQLEAQGGLEKWQIELVKGLIDTTFQAVEDSGGVLATIDFRATGLALHVESEMRPNTPTAGLLKGSKPAAFADLDKLPSGQAYYTAMQLSPALTKSFGPLAFGVTGGADDKDGKAVKAAIDDLVKAGPQERVDALNFPYTAVQMFRYADGAKALEANLKLTEALQSGVGFQSLLLKEKAVVKRKAEKYKDFDVASVRMVPDFDKMIDKSDPSGVLPPATRKQMIEMYKKSLGEEVKLWMGSDGKAVFTVIAADWKSAEKALNQYFDGKNTVGADGSYKLMRKELPAETTLCGIMDPVVYGLYLVDFVKVGFGAAGNGIIQLPAGWPALPTKPKATYFGGAVTLQPDRAALDLFFSADGIYETYKAFVKPFLGGGLGLE